MEMINCETEQVSEIGWLLYSMRKQDEKRLANNLLSSLTGEKIGACWRVIRTTIAARKHKGLKERRPIEVRAIHLECDSAMLQFAKTQGGSFISFFGH
jgi:hypothetical protein